MKKINLMALLFLSIAFITSGLLYYSHLPKRANYLACELYYPSQTFVPIQGYNFRFDTLIKNDKIEIVNLLDGYHKGDTVKIDYKNPSYFEPSYTLYLIIQKETHKNFYLDISKEYNLHSK